MAPSVPRMADREPDEPLPPPQPTPGDGTPDGDTAPAGSMSRLAGFVLPAKPVPPAPTTSAATDGTRANRGTTAAAQDMARIDPTGERPRAGRLTAAMGIRLEDPRAYPGMAGAPNDRWLRQLVGREGSWVTARNFRSAYLTVPDPREAGTYVPIVRDNGERVAVDFLEASNNPDNDYPPPAARELSAGSRLGPGAPSLTAKAESTLSQGLAGAGLNGGGASEVPQADDQAGPSRDGDEDDALTPEDVAEILAGLDTWERTQSVQVDRGILPGGTGRDALASGSGIDTLAGGAGYDILDDGEGDGIDRVDPATIPDPESLQGLIGDIEAALDRGLGELSDAERADLLRRIGAALEPVAGALPVIGNILSAKDAVEAFVAAFRAMQEGKTVEALGHVAEGVTDVVLATPAGTGFRIAKTGLDGARKLLKLLRRRPRGIPSDLPPPPDGPLRALFDASEERYRMMRARPLEPPYRMPARKAFDSIDPKSLKPDDQVRRGRAAVDMVLKSAREGKPVTVPNAMYRPDLAEILPKDILADGRGAPTGFIHFHWGTAKPDPKRIYQGKGLFKVIAKHGPETLEGMVETIAKGKAVRSSNPRNLTLEHTQGGETHRVSLGRLRKDEAAGDIWVVTAFEIGRRSDRPFDPKKLTGPIFYRD